MQLKFADDDLAEFVKVIKSQFSKLNTNAVLKVYTMEIDLFKKHRAIKCLKNEPANTYLIETVG